jgi:flagellar protein FlbB
MEIEKTRQELDSNRGEIEQMAQELEERQKALEELENSLKAKEKDAENKERNIEANARNLMNMQPERAVGIMSEMNDQDVLDVFRKTEELAQAAGTTSLVPYWYQLMAATPEGAKRAAELQRKMVNRPQSP